MSTTSATMLSSPTISSEVRMMTKPRSSRRHLLSHLLMAGRGVRRQIEVTAEERHLEPALAMDEDVDPEVGVAPVVVVAVGREAAAAATGRPRAGPATHHGAATGAGDEGDAHLGSGEVAAGPVDHRLLD